ncbi:MULTISPECIES: CHAD domain-containing protein [unclassified Nocardioides]|uniref:CHAD domain-containing protein n=1 Tax=unclassified Nocardioides TaxID=2615069 RepID=UPI000703B48A|nr:MULTISPECIES: CHAD domain-containing protein [unclassified Nocardioides]KRC54927.1 hypothetical protein ASE19_05595 [Nocardioides sp. Root79]KRC73729.1 hypothetical protein ASE20_03625 [Nocardioides sp. Root240]
MTTAGEMLSAVLADLADQTISRRSAALADEPDAVHQLRTTVRRQRNLLAAFRRCFDTEAASTVGAALASYGGLLGECRDLEVRADDTARALTALGLEHLDGRLVVPLREAHARAHATLVVWHTGPDAVRLDALLAGWAEAPVLAERARRPAEDVAAKAVRRQVRRVLARADAAADGSEEARHDLRRAARRLRHTADAVADVLTDDAVVRAGRLGQRIQGALGDHRDALLLADHVRRAGDPDDRLVDHAVQLAGEALDGLDEPLAELRRAAVP